MAPARVERRLAAIGDDLVDGILEAALQQQLRHRHQLRLAAAVHAAEAAREDARVPGAVQVQHLRLRHAQLERAAAGIGHQQYAAAGLVVKALQRGLAR